MSKITITIPTYNRANLVGNAIQSVLDQTDENWKLFITDDGSTDNTASIVSNFRDDRIFYFSRAENRGLVYTFNEMLNRIIETGTEYWSWLASDDVLFPDFVKEHKKGLDMLPVDVTWSDFISDTNGYKQLVCMKIDPAKIPEILPKRVCVSLASMCIRIETLRKIRDKYGTFCSTEFKHMNDWDFLLKLSSITNKFYYVAKPLAQYNIHEDMGSAGVYFGKAESKIAKQFLEDRAKMRYRNV